MVCEKERQGKGGEMMVEVVLKIGSEIGNDRAWVLAKER
jgi:hypothetical protein